jgi:hypothetical protein
MQRTVQIITSAIFALHALLGCAMHHSCQHGVAVARCEVGKKHQAHHCTCRHHAVAHDDDGASEPCHDDHAPADPCKYTSCSYVKAETQRVNLADHQVAAVLPAATIVALHSSPIASAVCVPVSRADLSATEIYVWHCALII